MYLKCWGERERGRERWICWFTLQEPTKASWSQESRAQCESLLRMAVSEVFESSGLPVVLWWAVSGSCRHLQGWDSWALGLGCALKVSCVHWVSTLSKGKWTEMGVGGWGSFSVKLKWSNWTFWSSVFLYIFYEWWKTMAFISNINLASQLMFATEMEFLGRSL